LAREGAIEIEDLLDFLHHAEGGFAEEEEIIGKHQVSEYRSSMVDLHTLVFAIRDPFVNKQREKFSNKNK